MARVIGPAPRSGAGANRVRSMPLGMTVSFRGGTRSTRRATSAVASDTATTRPVSSDAMRLTTTARNWWG
jgi:hypothetical protein